MFVCSFKPRSLFKKLLCAAAILAAVLLIALILHPFNRLLRCSLPPSMIPAFPTGWHRCGFYKATAGR